MKQLGWVPTSSRAAQTYLTTKDIARQESLGVWDNPFGSLQAAWQSGRYGLPSQINVLSGLEDATNSDSKPHWIFYVGALSALFIAGLKIGKILRIIR
jgi:hypothetical protein